VMAMSLVTVSAGAKDFADADDITYDEAVSVISTIGVVDGNNGSFLPTDGLTRGAAAKIICNLVLGPTTASALNADAAPFPDVPTNHVFAGYIAYCAQKGIIGGYGDGLFRPADGLSGYAFMKMLLGALGYDSGIEGFTGPNWTINVAKLAKGIGLDKSNPEFVGSAAVTREEACLYSFNTLQATIVDYDQKVSVNVAGAEVNLTNTTAKPVGSGNQNLQTGWSNKDNIKADQFVQFAEQYFTKLKLKNDVEVFGRPARYWEFDGKEIGTYVNYDLLVAEYTTEVTGKDLYDLLGKSILDEYKPYIYVDGIDDPTVGLKTVFTVADLNKNNKKGVGDTGKGVLTQVFVNPDDKEITIAVINTFLAIAQDDYNEKKDEVAFDVYRIAKDSDDNYYKFDTLDASGSHDVDYEDKLTMKVSGEDFAVADVKDEDKFLVNVAEGEIQIMKAAEIVEDTEISAFKLSSNVTAGGTKYDYANTAEYDVEVLDHYTNASGQNLKDSTYNLILDEYGYMIGLEIVEVPNNYIFITGMDGKYSNLAAKNVDVNAIFLDGTMETITVKRKDNDGLDPVTSATDAAKAGKYEDASTINRWFTYTVDKNNVYTVKSVNFDRTVAAKVNQGADLTWGAVPNQETIDKKHIALPGLGGAASGDKLFRVYGNNDSVYLTASIKELDINTNKTSLIIDDVDGVSTGIKNTNIEVWNAAQSYDANWGTRADIHADIKNAVKSGKDASGVLQATNTLAYYDENTDGWDDANDHYTGISGGVYTLFKDNGYIIAAVVVGEDAAASKNLVYAHSSNVEQEGYDKTADEWTWIRKVIQNGEEVELKYVGDQLEQIGVTGTEGSMTQYGWYQVKLNADGEVLTVTSVDHPTDGLETTVGNGTEYVTNVANLASAIDQTKEDTILFCSEFKNDKMTMKSSTLYVTTEDYQGVPVDEEVKIALIQTNKNKKTTEFDTGVKALENIVKNLNEKNGKYDYQVSLILENGIATSVVIYDKTNNYEKPEDSDKDSTGLYNGLYVVLGTRDTNSSSATVYTTDAVLDQDKAIEAFGLAAADALGLSRDAITVEYSATAIGGATPGYIATGKVGGIDRKYYFAPATPANMKTGSLEYKLDGKTAMADGAAGTISVTGIATTTGGWVRYTTDGGTTYAYANSSTIDAKLNNLEVETGFIKVTIATDSNKDYLANVFEDGGSMYAKATDKVSKGTKSDVGDVFTVNSKVLEYGKYTFADIDSASIEGSSDGTAAFDSDTLNQYRVNFHKADGTVVQEALKPGAAGEVDLTSTSDIEGTYTRIDSPTATPLNVSTAAVTAYKLKSDIDVYGYYVKATNLGFDASGAADTTTKLGVKFLNGSTEVKTGDYIDLSKKFEVVVTVKDAIATAATSGAVIALTTATGINATKPTPTLSANLTPGNFTLAAGSATQKNTGGGGETLTADSTITFTAAANSGYASTKANLDVQVKYTAPVV